MAGPYPDPFLRLRFGDDVSADFQITSKRCNVEVEVGLQPLWCVVDDVHGIDLVQHGFGVGLNTLPAALKAVFELVE